VKLPATQPFEGMVAGEELVGPFPGEDDLNVPPGQPGNEIAGYGAPHQRRVKGLQQVDDPGQYPGDFPRAVLESMVDGAQEGGHLTGALQVLAARHPHAEGVELSPYQPPGYGGDQAGIQAPAEEHPQRNVGHQAFGHGLAQLFFQCSQYFIRLVQVGRAGG